MVLAIGLMSAGGQTFFYAVAVVLFLLGAVGLKLPNERVRLDSLGLAFFVFVFLWSAAAATSRSTVRTGSAALDAGGYSLRYRGPGFDQRSLAGDPAGSM